MYNMTIFHNSSAIFLSFTDILLHVKTRFSITPSSSLSIEFVHLNAYSNYLGKCQYYIYIYIPNTRTSTRTIHRTLYDIFLILSFLTSHSCHRAFESILPGGRIMGNDDACLQGIAKESTTHIHRYDRMCLYVLRGQNLGWMSGCRLCSLSHHQYGYAGTSVGTSTNLQ